MCKVLKQLVYYQMNISPFLRLVNCFNGKDKLITVYTGG